MDAGTERINASCTYLYEVYTCKCKTRDEAKEEDECNEISIFYHENVTDTFEKAELIESKARRVIFTSIRKCL